MITIAIRTDGDRVADKLDISKPNMLEAAICIYKLEQIKQKLLAIPFKNDFEVFKPSGKNVG